MLHSHPESLPHFMDFAVSHYRNGHLPLLAVAVGLIVLLGSRLPTHAAEAATAPTGEPAAADAEAADDPAAGHSYHGEAFNEGPRQAAYLIGGTGNVHLAVSSRHPQVQAFFDQGVGQLHGYWYFEAERSFRQAAALDPDCAMAYWGMCLANVNNNERASKFIEEAVKRRDQASERERMWIDAWSAYYKPSKKEEKDRRRDLVRALENIIDAHPNELEAKALLAGLIYTNSSKGLAITSHQAVDALIAQVLDVEPLHPVHHYRIHLWDSEKPSRALHAAAHCGQGSPAIAHMWHMPGHIYSKLHRYHDAIWQQEASGRVDHAYMIRDRILPDQIHNYAHNQEWMIRNLMHAGRADEALRLARNLIEIPRHPAYNIPSKKSTSQYGRTRLLEVLVKFELWDQLLQLAETPWLEPGEKATEQARRLRAMAAAQFARGHTAAGAQTIALLESLVNDARTQQQADVAEAEQQAREKKQSDDQVAKAAEAARKKQQPTILSLEAAWIEARGHAQLAAGDPTAALALFNECATKGSGEGLGKDRLALVYSLAGNHDKAQQLAREAVSSAPGQVVPLAVQAYVLAQGGKESDAAKSFEALRKLSASLDLKLPPFARLSALANQLGLPADWRLPAESQTDLGQRPDLNSLGPIAWQPAPAGDWKLPDAEGNTVSLAQYRGRPVVVIFYLGFGCLHCVEQLKAFSPLAEEFRGQGIELVAISSESVAELAAALGDLTASQRPALPLVSDAELNVFRQWRAYDDFEQQPLHATFLVDGEGRVRWQDISYEPFSNAQFLLDEARRLFALDAAR